MSGASRFLELKWSIIERLKIVDKLLADRTKWGQNGGEIFEAQAEIRYQIAQSGEEWDELESLYDKSDKLKNPSKSELEMQRTFVQSLHEQIKRLKDTHLTDSTAYIPYHVASNSKTETTLLPSSSGGTTTTTSLKSRNNKKIPSVALMQGPQLMDFIDKIKQRMSQWKKIARATTVRQ